jgi:hypothetical protein
MINTFTDKKEQVVQVARFVGSFSGTIPRFSLIESNCIDA